MSAPRSLSGEAPTGRGGFPRLLVSLVVVVTLARLCCGALLHLTEDEAYYRLWSMAPALGYYDHPPMVAWWVWLGRQAAGDTALGVRLLPILAGAIVSFLVYDIARLIGAGEADAARAGIWYNAMLLVAAGGVLAVPDAPAATFWILTIWCVLRAVRDSSTAWWMGAGAAAGLAVLSKYSALFLAPGLLLWLAWTATTRSQLGKPGPWLAALLAASLFSLNIAWNADHHWLTFIKQFGRVVPKSLEPGHLGAFLAAQLLLINPLIAIFLIRASQSARIRAATLPLVLTSAPFLVYLLIHSLHDSVQAHWPAPVYPALAVMAALAAGKMPSLGGFAGVARAAPIVGFLVYPLILLACFLPAPLLSRIAGPIVGWRSFADRLEAVRVESGTAWVGTMSYGLAAQLADEPSLRAPVLQINERERYAGLSMPPPDLDRPGLVIDLIRRFNAGDLSRCFVSVLRVGTLDRAPPSPPAKLYVIFRVAGPRRNVLSAGCR